MSELEGLHQLTRSGSRPHVRTVLFGPEQRRRTLSLYKPSNEIGGLAKQASCLIITPNLKSQKRGVIPFPVCVRVCGEGRVERWW